VGADVIRVISDLHYGDHSCRVGTLEALRPLLEGASSLILNGDSLDTRQGRHPERTAQKRREVLDFFSTAGIPVTFLTGNHDPDLSPHHAAEFEGGRILITHGDVLFDAIVPWSKNAPEIRRKILAALLDLPGDSGLHLDGQLRAFRTVAASLPQRHQMEPDPVRYALSLVGDTVWPPHKVLSIFRAWRETPGRAAALARRHRPRARFIAIGHTHMPGVWKTPSGVVVINTGSFCRPFSALVLEISPGRLRVRSVVSRGGAYHPGAEVAAFSTA
jgi:UDP-2,3-diacylglucosamine pyrophosphatase LpxH